VNDAYVLVSGLALLLLAILLAAACWLLRRHLRDQKDSVDGLRQRVDLMSGQMVDVQKNASDAIQQTLQTLQGSQQTMVTRLQETSERLGQVSEATRRLSEIAKEIEEIQTVLRAPQARGGLGELLLYDLLKQMLPQEHFETQYSIGNDRVDAIIRLGENMLPIDSKFPLGKWQEIQTCEDTQRTRARKEFARHVKAHIDTIAGKYIRTDLGTFDFAMMYVPAEGVYYEAFVCTEEGVRGLVEYAMDKRVVPVSPNSFYAYLQTILLGLRAFQIEERAKEVLGHLAAFRKDVQKVDEDCTTLTRHLENAAKKAKDVATGIGKLDGQVGSLLLAGSAPPALPEAEAEESN
jgi:DNA recombination protein RmuC